jgi:hypothetical protein
MVRTATRQGCQQCSEEQSQKPRIRPGLKWGHAAKILSIYLRGLVLHSRYFPDRVVHRVKPWLFVPVDSYTIKNLKRCKIQPPFNYIKDISTRKDFYFTQNVLARHCRRGTARIVFDDGWADRTNPNK